MKTYKLYLIRHAKTNANYEGRYIGKKTDEDICEQGAAEILELMEEYEYPNVGRVYSSPLKRAVETARLIYKYHTPVTVNDLAEYDFGEFENRKSDELLKDEHYLNWLENSNLAAPSGGESMQQFKDRIMQGINTVVSDMMKSGVSQAAVITHGGVISMILAACGLPKRDMSQWVIPNGEGYTLLINPGLWLNSHVGEVFTAVPYGTKKDEIMIDYQKSIEDEE